MSNVFSEPTIFNMSKITLEAGDDRALRYTNLANLYEGLETYYTKVKSMVIKLTKVKGLE